MKKSTWRYWAAALVALMAGLGLGTMVNGTTAAAPITGGSGNTGARGQNPANGMVVVSSYHNDTSPALRAIPPVAIVFEKRNPKGGDKKPKVPYAGANLTSVQEAPRWRLA